MTFSRCSSYRKDTWYYDEYIGVQYVLNKLEGTMTAFREYGIFVGDKSVHIIQLHKTICISLKTVRGVQSSIVESFLTMI